MRSELDREGRIVNDPNEFSLDPYYMVELTGEVVRGCVETVRLQSEMFDYH